MISGNLLRRTTLSTLLGATVLGTALLTGCSDNKPAGGPPMGPRRLLRSTGDLLT